MEYIEDLSQEQREALLMILAHIAHADGLYDEDENEFIHTMAYMYGVPESRMPSIVELRSNDEIAQHATSLKNDRKACLFMAREMFTLAHADGEMSDDEILAITMIGDAMGLSLEKLEEISEWVIDGMEWQERGHILFENNDIA